MTVTGRTMADNLAALDPPAPDGDVVHVLSDPIHAQGGIAVLTGSLAKAASSRSDTEPDVSTAISTSPKASLCSDGR